MDRCSLRRCRQEMQADKIANKKPFLYGEEAKKLKGTYKEIIIPIEDAEYVSKETISLFKNNSTSSNIAFPPDLDTSSWPKGMRTYPHFYLLYYVAGLTSNNEYFIPFERRNQHLILLLPKLFREYAETKDPKNLDIIISAFIRELGYIYDLYINGIVRNKKIVKKILLAYSNGNYVDMENVQDIVYNIRLYCTHLFSDPDDFEHFLLERLVRMINNFSDKLIIGKETRIISMFMDYYHRVIIRDMYKRQRGEKDSVYFMTPREPIIPNGLMMDEVYSSGCLESLVAKENPFDIFISNLTQ